MPTEKKKILVVDDAENIRNTLKEIFTRSNYDVETELNGRLAYEKILRGNFDLVVLDVMLPEMDGLEVCQRVREFSQFPPIIMLSSRREDEIILKGLKIGALEYITKPFQIPVLLQKVKNFLALREEITKKKFTYLITKDLVLCPESHEVRVDYEKISLTKNEFRLLQYLLENKSRVITREELIREVWKFLNDKDCGVVDVSVHNLRKKLCSDVGATEKYIQTVRGAGYVIKD